MSYKIIASVSLLTVGLLSTGCSRNKPLAGGPTPSTTAADRAAMDAADRENARLRAEADRAAAAARADAERAEKAREEARSTLTTPVRFEFDRSQLTDEALQLLDAKVGALQANPSVRVRIEGNADDSGSDEYNMALSQRRSAIAHRYLTERGVDGSRLQIVSNGEEKPACTTSREEPCRAQNRRDEFVILSGL
jgi:peptidoglycan-associated lipoprotein